MKFLAMLVTNKKISLNIFTVENVQNIFMKHDLKLTQNLARVYL